MTSQPTEPYRGRFAPSPTGPLHLGSAVAAIASWLDARAHAGQWLVRIDDVDTTRAVAGADRQILAELARLGLVPDAPVVYQSQRSAVYNTAIARLQAQGRAFDCGCSRRDVGKGPYPGTCRLGLAPGVKARSVRAVVDAAPVKFVDRIADMQSANLSTLTGAFVIKRADGLAAYHLACVVDDDDARVTHVVRGADLLPSTHAQIHLQHLLGIPTPAYLHVPVVNDQHGQKLSKQTHAAPSSSLSASSIWQFACEFLGVLRTGELVQAPVKSYKLLGQERWLDAIAGPRRSNQ